MANYVSATRTNYFHVKDVETFRAFMDNVSGDNLELWDEKDDKGDTVFAFGCEGSIYGIQNEDGNDDYDLFVENLQEYIADNDAVILTETGHENLRYVSGYAAIITGSDIQHVNLDDMALSKSREMLGNPGFSTQMDY